MVKAKAADNALVEFGVLNELRGIYDRAIKLSDAVDAWLTDPDDPTRYSIDPRAEDINVIYTWREAGRNGGITTKRRKEKLSALLKKINQVNGGGWEFELVESRIADPGT